MERKKTTIRNSDGTEHKSYLFQKLATIALLVFLTLYAYSKREWFSNIPQKAEQSKVEIPNKAKNDPKNSKTTAVPLPGKGVKDGPGIIARVKNLFSKPEKIDERDPLFLNGTLDTLYSIIGVDPKNVKRKILQKPLFVVEEQVFVPKGRPVPEIILLVKNEIDKKKLQMFNVTENLKDSSILMEIAARSGVVRTIKLSRNRDKILSVSRLAVVVEGFGMEFVPEAEKLFAIKGITSLTLGIVPLAPQSVYYKSLALKNGHEIISMIPMESIPYKNLGVKAIYKRTERAKLEKLLEEMDANLPEAAGFSIYGGGLRILEDEPQHLNSIFSYIKKNNKYFLENVNSVRSHGMACSKEIGVDYVRTSVFVEKSERPEDVYQSVQKYSSTVMKTGNGVVVFRSPAVAVASLPKIVNVLDSLGIKMVPLSSLFVK